MLKHTFNVNPPGCLLEGASSVFFVLSLFVTSRGEDVYVKRARLPCILGSVSSYSVSAFPSLNLTSAEAASFTFDRWSHLLAVSLWQSALST